MYRGALVVDTLIQQGYDAAVSTDSTASVQVPDGSYTTRAVIQTAVATIRGKNGRPFAGGRHRGIMHPYILADLANDLTANGVLDTEKYTREGQKWIEAGLKTARSCYKKFRCIGGTLPHGRQRRGNPLLGRVRRDYTRNGSDRTEDIVRSAWRHAANTNVQKTTKSSRLPEWIS